MSPVLFKVHPTSEPRDAYLACATMPRPGYAACVSSVTTVIIVDARLLSIIRTRRTV
jgi:hypothetical protein